MAIQGIESVIQQLQLGSLQASNRSTDNVAQADFAAQVMTPNY